MESWEETIALEESVENPRKLEETFGKRSNCRKETLERTVGKRSTRQAKKA